MWTSLFNGCLGLFLLLAPDLFDYEIAEASALSRVVGAVILASSIIAFSEVTAFVRWFSVLCGFILLMTPLLWFRSDLPSSVVVNVISGFIIIGLGIPVRRARQLRGGGWTSLWRSQDEGSRLNWN